MTLYRVGVRQWVVLGLLAQGGDDGVSFPDLHRCLRKRGLTFDVSPVLEALVATGRANYIESARIYTLTPYGAMALRGKSQSDYPHFIRLALPKGERQEATS
jgi:hypothetical protein